MSAASALGTLKCQVCLQMIRHKKRIQLDPFLLSYIWGQTKGQTPFITYLCTFLWAHVVDGDTSNGYWVLHGITTEGLA